MKRKWWLLAAGLGLIIALIVGFNWFQKGDKAQTVNIATTQVRKGNLEVNVTGTGSIQPAERESLTSTTAGTVKEVRFQAGDKVKKGDVLVALEAQDMNDKIQAEELNLEKKLLDLEDLQNKLKNATDESSQSNLTISIKKQQLDIQSSRTQIASLKKEEQPEPIVSPIDGVLTTVGVKAGDQINPSTAVAEVANYSSLQVVVGIDELDIPKVKVGQKAEISVEALPDHKYAGEVTKVADEGTSTNGVASFDVTIRLDDVKDVKAGMSAEASIQVESKTNVLYLPIEAVQSFRNRYFVMVPATSAQAGNGSGQNGESDASRNNGNSTSGNGQNGSNMSQRMQVQNGNAGQFRQGGAFSVLSSANGTGTRKQITVGIHNEDYIEIVSGLNEGDTVQLPMVMSSTTMRQNQAGFPGFGFGGGFGGNGGGFRQGGNGGGIRQGGNGGDSRTQSGESGGGTQGSNGGGQR